MDQSQGNHTCQGIVGDGFVNSFSHLFNKCLLNTYCVLNLALGLVRGEGLMMDSECEANNSENAPAMPWGILRINKILYSECSVSHYTPW